MVGTLEDALARKRREDEPLDGLTEFDATVLGGKGGKYIYVPHITDMHNLKRIGGLLQGLGADMVNLSNRHEFPMRTKLFELRGLIDDFNRRVREMTGKGKRKKPWERD